MESKPCTICGKEMLRNGRGYKYFESRKFCSMNCYRKSESYASGIYKKGHEGLCGDKNPAWKGGMVNHVKGYFKIRTDKKIYRLQHRYIIENSLGRSISRGEVVHHINGDKKDNRLENLMLMSNSEHSRLHAKMRRDIKKENKI